MYKHYWTQIKHDQTDPKIFVRRFSWQSRIQHVGMAQKSSKRPRVASRTAQPWIPSGRGLQKFAWKFTAVIEIMRFSMPENHYLFHGKKTHHFYGTSMLFIGNLMISMASSSVANHVSHIQPTWMLTPNGGPHPLRCDFFYRSTVW